jgi:HEAT repeat protein
LAKSILDEMWEKKPFQAAESICIRGWKFLMILGDKDARQRLISMAHSDHERSLTAAAALCAEENENEIQYWLDLASDKQKSLDERIRALRVLCTRFAPFTLEPLALQVDTLCRELMQTRNPRYQRLALQAMANVGCSRVTEQYVREFLESCVSGSREHGSEASRLARAGPNGCVAGYALDTLKHRKSQASADVLRLACERSPWDGIRRGAAELLHELGDRQTAKNCLVHGFNAAADIETRLMYAFSLARIGEESYQNMLRDAMRHEDGGVRESAYLGLFWLGDGAFLEKAAKNAEQDSFPAFGRIGSLSGSLKDRPVQRGLWEEYLTALSRNGIKDEIRDQALRYLLMDEDARLEGVLPGCLRAVDSPAPAYPLNPRSSEEGQLRRCRLYLIQMLVVMRAGVPEQRRAAFARVQQIYETAGKDGQARIPRVLGVSRYRGALPFLTSVMSDPSNPARLHAAVSLLAIEAERVSL